MGKAIEIKLTAKQRQELEAIVGRTSESAGLVRRARAVLLSERGLSGREVALRVELTPPSTGATCRSRQFVRAWHARGESVARGPSSREVSLHSHKRFVAE